MTIVGVYLCVWSVEQVHVNQWPLLDDLGAHDYYVRLTLKGNSSVPNCPILTNKVPMESS